MSCEKCCNTCECGHEYKSWSKERLENLINTLNKILEEKPSNNVLKES